MGRHDGYSHSPEDRERISEGMRRSWAERKEHSQFTNSILNAVAEGDYETASRLYHEHTDGVRGQMMNGGRQGTEEVLEDGTTLIDRPGFMVVCPPGTRRQRSASNAGKRIYDQDATSDIDDDAIAFAFSRQVLNSLGKKGSKK